MKQARRKAAHRALHARRCRERLQAAIRLFTRARQHCRHHRIGEEACAHEWLHEGQTPTGNIVSCTRCGVLRFG